MVFLSFFFNGHSKWQTFSAHKKKESSAHNEQLNKYCPPPSCSWSNTSQFTKKTRCDFTLFESDFKMSDLISLLKHNFKFSCYRTRNYLNFQKCTVGKNPTSFIIIGYLEIRMVTKLDVNKDFCPLCITLVLHTLGAIYIVNWSLLHFHACFWKSKMSEKWCGIL